MSDATAVDIDEDEDEDEDDVEESETADTPDAIEGAKDPQLDATTATFDPFAAAVQPVAPYPAPDARPESFDDPAFAPGTPNYPQRPRNRNFGQQGAQVGLPDGFTLHVKPPAPQPKPPAEPKYDPLRFLARQKEGRIRIKRLVDSLIDSKGFYKTEDGDRVKVGHGECGFMPSGSPEEITNYIKDVWGGGTYELTHFDKDDKMINQGIMQLPQVPKPIDGVQDDENEYDDMEQYPPTQGAEMPPYVPGMPVGRDLRMDPRFGGMGGRYPTMDEFGQPIRRMPPVVNTYRPPEELIEAKKELELLKQRLDAERHERERVEKERLQEVHKAQLEMLKKQIEDSTKLSEHQKAAETASLQVQLEALKKAMETPRTDPALPMVEMMRLQQAEQAARWEKEIEFRRLQDEKEAKERQAQREAQQAALERESRERAAQITAQAALEERRAAQVAEQARLQAAALAAQQPKTDPIVMLMESMRLQATEAQRKWEQEREEQRRRDDREKEERDRKDREERERREAERAERERKERDERERREDERKERERREREEREERRAERERAERREEERRKYELEKEDQRRREQIERDEQRRREQAEHMKFLFDQQKAAVGQQNPLQMLREALKLGNEIKDQVGEAPAADNGMAGTLATLAPMLAAAGGALVNKLGQQPEQQPPVQAPPVQVITHQPNPNPPSPQQVAAQQAAAAAQAKAKQENQAQMIGQYAQILKAASVAFKDKKTPAEGVQAIFAKAVELNARKNLDMLKNKSVDDINGFLLVAKGSGLVGGMNLASLEEFMALIASPEGNKWVAEVLEGLKAV